MRRSDDYKMRLVLAGIAAVVAMSGKIADADFTFGEPTNLGVTVNSAAGEVCPSISPDGLELYFHSADLSGGYGNGDLWTSRRGTVSDPWETPTNLGPVVNSPSYEYNPFISPDGLSLYFMSSRPGGYGLGDIWLSTRLTTDIPWGEPMNLGSMINSSASETRVALPADGLELYFCASGRPGGRGDSDLWITTRPTREDTWSTPTALPLPLNTAQYDGQPAISADGLLLLFRSKRDGGIGANDMWMTTRRTRGDAWGVPVNLGPTINTPDSEAGPSISADGQVLYFHSARPGGFGSHDIYSAPIIPIVDLNRDGIVDAQDMCIMVDNWGTDNSLCDIGPMPWGDGVVDVQDLIILAEHLFEESPPAEMAKSRE